jgi:hypothetical protein
MTGSLRKNWNEAVVASFKVMSHICPEELENYEYHSYNSRSRGQILKPEVLEFEARFLTTPPRLLINSC